MSDRAGPTPGHPVNSPLAATAFPRRRSTALTPTRCIFIAGLLFRLAPVPAAEASAGRTDPNAARSPAQVVAAEDTTPADLLLATGHSAYRASRYAEAAASFQKFFDLYGQSTEAQAARERIYPMLGGALLAEGKTAQALPFLRQYLDLFPAGPARPEVSLWCGLAMFGEKDCANAVAALDRFCAEFPRHGQATRAAFIAALAARGASDIRGAAARFSELAGAHDALLAERSSLMQAQCEIELGKTDEAFRLLDSLARRNPPPCQQALLAALALALGDEFMGGAEPEKAWRCYLLVPTRGRILRRHSEAMAELESRPAAGAAATAPPEGRHQPDPVREALLSEKMKIEGIADFDAARHLRLARAALQLGWHHEAFVAANEAWRCLPDGSAAKPDATFLSIMSAAGSHRWRAVLERCAAFLKCHPSDTRAPNVEFIAAQAHLELRDYRKARDAFLAHNHNHPSFPEADRSLFLAGYAALCSDQHGDAAATFADVCRRYKASPLCEQARYWTAMAAVFSKDYDAAIDRFDGYLAAHPTGAFKEEAIYRKAAARYAKREFGDARKALQRWLDDFAGHPLTDEVRALNGDSCLTFGDVDAALLSYRAIDRGSAAIWHYAQFQMAKALRLSEREAELETHLRDFIAARPDSPRIAEAFRHLAKKLAAGGRRDEAIALYRDAIARVAGDPRNRSAEELMMGLAAMHRSAEERSRFEDELRRRADEARASRQPAVAARCVWLIAKLARRDKEKVGGLLLELAKEFTPDQLSPIASIEVAEFLTTTDRAEDASPHFLRIVGMGATTPEYPRALAGLGLAAARAGDWKAALEYFDRFDREANSSPLRARVLQAKADILLDRGRHADAVACLEQLLELPSAPGASKARGLCKLGESHIALGHPEKAVACYQRVYVMYGAHREWVAKAYLASGQILERLKLWDGAKKTYEELLAHGDLDVFAEHALARARLADLK